MRELTHAQALKKFLDLLPEKGAILEVNPDQGHYSQVFSSKGYKILAIQTDSLSPIKNPLSVDTFHGELHEALIPYRSLIGIWAPRVLSEYSREEALLSIRNFSDWIHPTGVIALSVLEGEGEKVIQPSMTGQPEKMLVYYEPNEISWMLENAGLVAVDAWREIIHEQPSLQVICRSL